MAGGLTTAALRVGLARIAARMEIRADDLNSVDAALGDGDLGVTMKRGARGVSAELPNLPDDVGAALLGCAQAFVKVSASSYGTLLATGLMSAAKAAKGRTEVPWGEMSALLGAALEAMTARGKGALGAKTVLDSVDAVRRAIDGLDQPEDILAAAAAASERSLERYRGRRSQLGRARIWGDKSIGRDDPGMVAFDEMIEGLRAGEGST